MTQSGELPPEVKNPVLREFACALRAGVDLAISNPRITEGQIDAAIVDEWNRWQAWNTRPSLDAGEGVEAIADAADAVVAAFERFNHAEHNRQDCPECENDGAWWECEPCSETIGDLLNAHLLAVEAYKRTRALATLSAPQSPPSVDGLVEDETPHDKIEWPKNGDPTLSYGCGHADGKAGNAPRGSSPEYEDGYVAGTALRATPEAGTEATPSADAMRAENERIAIVSWLRGLSNSCRVEAMNPENDDEVQDAWVTRMETYGFAADQIEADAYQPRAALTDANEGGSDA